MSGGSLATKGLVSGGGGSLLVETPTVLPAPPAPAAVGTPTSPTGTVMILIPTAPNMCLMAAENIIANLRVRQPSNLSVLSLYKRAHLITAELDEIAVTKPGT